MRKAPLELCTLAPSLLALLAVTTTATADSYRAARAEMITAYEAQDYAAMRAHAVEALSARPGFAGGLFNLALAEALGGDAEASLKTLMRLLAQGVDFAVADQDEFAALKKLPGWDAYEEAVAALYEPVGNARVAWRLDRSDFIPEGIAISDTDDLYLGSIRNGDIVRLAKKTTTIAVSADGPHWSVYGMRLRDGRLWFVSSAVSQFAALVQGDAGKNGLFAIELATGRVTTRAFLPDKESQQVLGDLEFAGDGTVLLADQTDGTIYRYKIDEQSLAILVGPGVLGSPQGMALDETGEHAYVADYIGGVARVELATGAVVQVDAPETINTYGIDGLYRYGDRLIAIQNGVQPNRVSEYTLSSDGLSVVSSRILAMNLPEFDEPNLGQVKGDSFYFIANSHWNRFDGSGSLPADLSGPIILEIDLKSGQQAVE